MIEISSQLSGVIEGREKTPIGMVMVWDTTNTVPSNGFFVRYYSGLAPFGANAVKRTQFESSIMKDWAGGLPVELSKYVQTYSTNSGVTISDPFTVVYSGYFFAKASGTYNFAVRTNMAAEIYFNNSQILTGTQQISPGVLAGANTIFAGKQKYWNGTATVDTGWYPYKLNVSWYRTPSGNFTNPYVTALYTEPRSTDEKLITASSVNYTPNFISPTVLGKVMSINTDIDSELSTQVNFEVSVVPSGEYSWSRAREDFGALKLNRLCSVFMGYATESGYAQTNGYTSNLASCSDFVKQFTGSIDSVSTAQGQETMTATVSCRDFKKKLINSLNENYPNRANYSPKVLSQIDSTGRFGIDDLMPQAYDGWSAYNVIETMCLNGGIDPEKLDRSLWDIQNHFVLESNLNWPYTSTYDINNVETKNGDPYIFQMTYGETLNDEVRKVSDLIGYGVYFDRNGNLNVKEPRRTNRIEIYETGIYGSRALFLSGNWTVGLDINASNRLYLTPQANSFARFNFSGVGFGIHQTLNPTGGLYTVDIKNSSNTSVFRQTYDATSGVSYNNINLVTNSLPLASYDAYILPSGNFRLEGLEYYTANIYKPVYTLKDDRDISTISIDLNDSSVRNEVIAVGQQTSDKGYLYSKAIDLDSISNPDSFNYVGDKRTFVLVEPTIQSQSRLDWMSSNILGRFRRKQRNINVVAQGLPHLEINDPVGIISRKASLDSSTVSGYDIDNNEVYYINRISSSMSKGSYTTNLSLTSLKPIESWRPPLSITTDILKTIYDNNNNSIFANYRQDTMNAPNGTQAYDGFSNQAAFVSFDLLLDVDRLWVLIADGEDGGEVFKNIDTNRKDPLIAYQIAKGTDPNQPPRGAVWLHNGGGERWGRITVPTANNTFNGGQWIGQNSDSKVRLSGNYPLAIWAQFRTSDNSAVFQGIWVPTSGTLLNSNRQQAWSTSSQYNTYISYNATNGGQTLQTPVNPSLQLSYLPSFRVKNSDFKVDMWIGPPSSGYKMIDGNLLVDMSNKFTNLGNQWNSYYENSIRQNYPIGFPFTQQWYPEAEGSVVSQVLPNGQTVSARNVPWNVGDNVLFRGNPPSTVDIENVYYGVYRDRTITNRSGYKNVFGFTPQGFDYLNIGAGSAVPSYAAPYAYASVYSSGARETLFHNLNFLTIRPNRDAYLSYRCSIIQAWQSRYPIGGYPYPGGTYGAGDYAYVYNLITPYQNTVGVGVPIAGPIAVYIDPPPFVNNTVGYTPLGALYRNSYLPVGTEDNIKYRNSMNVLNYNNNGVAAGAMLYNMYSAQYYALNDDPTVFHYFMFTDAKTNEKYYYCMRTNQQFEYPANGRPFPLAYAPYPGADYYVKNFARVLP